MARIYRIPMAAILLGSIGASPAGPAIGCNDNDVPIATNSSIDRSLLEAGASQVSSDASSHVADSGKGVSCPAGSPLSCRVSKCSGGAHTTLTGKVYDPAGKVALSGVSVFIPNTTAVMNVLPGITPGTSACGGCASAIGDYVSAAVSDSTGSFTLQDVPTGADVPLVVQVGKWRRAITISNISDCATTALPDSGSGQARLPRSTSEGDMPQMALLTGGLDDLGCFLRRVGIDASEYSAPRAGGRLDIYQGLSARSDKAPALSTGVAGNCTDDNCPLWANKQTLEKYDIVLLACEGDTFDPAAAIDGGAAPGAAMNVTTSAKNAMHDWLSEGGRVFATHFQYTWFQNGPADFQGVASWLGSSAETGECTDCVIDTSFQNGQTLHDWLEAGGALTSGGLDLTGVGASVAGVSGAATRWIYEASTGTTKGLSFATPIGEVSIAGGPPQYCGKATFTDVHAGSTPSGDLPGACGTDDLTPQERLLEFLFFDLASCVVP